MISCCQKWITSFFQTKVFFVHLWVAKISLGKLEYFNSGDDLGKIVKLGRCVFYIFPSSFPHLFSLHSLPPGSPHFIGLPSNGYFGLPPSQGIPLCGSSWPFLFTSLTPNLFVLCLLPLLLFSIQFKYRAMFCVVWSLEKNRKLCIQNHVQRRIFTLIEKK
jgi:hypothetical protein